MDKHLLNQVTQQLKQAASGSPTPVGEPVEASIEQKEAINQIFELFRFNYHNQFLKAFPDHDTLLMGKRLWARLLKDYSATAIMRAAELAVKESRWLPTVHDVIEHCQSAPTAGLPNAYSAYIEACRAPSPKREYAWSHPIVYYAGKASDWHFLATTPEQYAFPVFERNYEILLRHIEAGEELSIELPKALPETVYVPLTEQERQEQAAALKQLFN